MMATTFAKSAPDHIYGLDSSNWIPVMGNRDVVELWGIGKRTATRLAAHDLRTVTDLALADRDDLAAWFGPTIGARLRVLARGGILTGHHDRAMAGPVEESPSDLCPRPH